MKIATIIIARGNSRGIPRKNLVDFAGKPLISHMICAARLALPEADTVVSTEDSEIAEVALEYGAEVPFMRPMELAEDHITSLPVVQHAIKELEGMGRGPYDIICYLQPTAPLCRPTDIRACVETLIQNPNIQSAVTITEAETHPFRLKRLLANGQLVNYIDQGFEDMRPRQTLPKVYRRSGAAYVSRRTVVMDAHSLVGDPCMGVIVSKETAIDIDSELDLELASMQFSKLYPNHTATKL